MSEADNLFPDNHVGTIKPANLRTFGKYLLAAYNRVHMNDDLEGLEDLIALGGGATQAQANARAEALRVAMVAHMDSVGSPAVDGDHLAADPINRANLTDIPTLTGTSDLAACITLVNGLNESLRAHATQPGVHFHDAVASIGTPDYPLCHCSAEITAVNDGMGGVTYSHEIVNVSGGVVPGELNQDNLPSFLTLGLTLPVEVERDLRVTTLSFRIVTDPEDPEPLGSISIEPFLPYSYEISGATDQVVIAIPLTSPNDAPITRIIGITYVLSVASTPEGAQMSIDPPTTLGHVITDLNDLLLSFKAHFADA
jgi:hypothetical protein